MDKKILLMAGLVVVALVLFGCTAQNQNGTDQNLSMDTASVDAAINSSEAAVDASINDLPDVPDINSGDFGVSQSQGVDIVIDDNAIASSIDAADAQIDSMSDFSTLDGVSSLDLNAK